MFAGWAEAFSKQCAEREYLSAALLNGALLKHVQAGALAVPESLEMVGFGRVLPSQRALLGDCGSAGLWCGSEGWRVGGGG